MKCVALCILSSLSTLCAQQAPLAVTADLLYTGVGEPIRQGVVLIRDGKIAAVGAAGTVTVPAGARTISAKVVTPGLVDAHTTVGLSGYLNQPHDQDQLEKSAPMQPELRAIDAFNAREKLVEWVRSFGVTTLHTGHAPGALISGQTCIVKTRGRGVDQDVVVATAMVACSLGELATSSGGRDGGKSPGTRSKAVAMLREELSKAREYATKRNNPDESKRPPEDLRLNTLAEVVSGKLPLLVSAHREFDIAAALRIGKEFQLRLVLDGAAESYLMLDAIRAAQVPVIAAAPMARHSGPARNGTFEQCAQLRDAGVLFALQSGYESYVPKTRVVLFEAAIAAKWGLTTTQAIQAVSLDAAKILGIDQRLGSLQVGKDADLAMFDGDPLEYATHCTGVIIDGEAMMGGR